MNARILLDGTSTRGEAPWPPASNWEPVRGNPADPPDPSHDSCWCRPGYPGTDPDRAMRWAPSSDPLYGGWGWLA